MSIQFGTAPAALPPVTEQAAGFEDWELDVSIVESGPEADKLIRMTDDGCGTTCQSACSPTCP
ncbi:FxLD family lantipeptide [Actinomadura craniellae]|uniref:FxLD family lantipeptide n=1 Tax=Actinomadura craniellae TaxID=2231787 RepID=A0A365H7E7_9ACTN|nr:FxLD family lanthipeptide [Actinomadura craniellae]RAY15001.1 FxLD family lantipeptide [Actinomadura craniellae]